MTALVRVVIIRSRSDSHGESYVIIRSRSDSPGEGCYYKIEE